MMLDYTAAPRTQENDAREQAALDTYNRLFRSDLYRMATQGKTNRYANDLIDAALERCGSPYYRAPRRPFGSQARLFLSQYPHHEQERTLAKGKVTIRVDVLKKTYSLDYHCDAVEALLMYSAYVRLEENLLILKGFKKV